MEDALLDDGDIQREGEVAPALIAVDPRGRFVVVAIGSDLRVFDLLDGLPVALSDDSNGFRHSDAIRAFCFDVKGKLFASAGDDKLVKVWSLDSWRCICTVRSEKRVSAVAISPCARYVCFADKFGVVWVVGLEEEKAGHHALIDKKASSLLGHYCSIITSLEFSSDGRFIASADRDFKIRLTSFPLRPLMGAHEIQSFCLGHTDFVSCLAFVHPPDCPNGFLISGGGDSTVRLWDFISGSLLDTCELGAMVGIVGSNTEGDEVCQAVTNLCALKSGSMIAASIQSLQGVALLYYDRSTEALKVSQVVAIGENYIPTSLALSPSAEYLWMVMGASSAIPSETALSIARIKVITGLRGVISNDHTHNPVVLEDEKVPGGAKLLEKLQGMVDIEKHAELLSSTTEALKTAMRSLLIKKQYSVEKREHRKRGRNDRKAKKK